MSIRLNCSSVPSGRQRLKLKSDRMPAGYLRVVASATRSNMGVGNNLPITNSCCPSPHKAFARLMLGYAGQDDWIVGLSAFAVFADCPVDGLY